MLIRMIYISVHKKNTFSFLFSLVFLKLILAFSYSYIISDSFNYSGFNYEFYYGRYLVGWVLYLACFPLLNSILNKVSDYYYLMALMFVVAPLIILYESDLSRSLAPVIAMILSLYTTFIFSNYLPISFKRIARIKGGMKISILLCVFFVLLLVVIYLKTGVKINFNFSKVYDFRIENALASAQGIYSYTNNWTYKVFNMFLFALALHYKKYSVALLVLVVQVYFFGASSHKSVLFYPLLVISSWLYFTRTRKLSIIPYIISVLLIVTVLAKVIYGDLLLSSFISRRTFFVPANLTFIYFDFFANNSFIYWSNSVLSSIFQYPYIESIPKVIGNHMGLPDMSANNGYLSTGYAHGGFVGVAFYSILIGFILKFLDDIVSNTIPVWLAVSFSIIPLRNLLVASDLFTVLLTHGLIVALFLIYMSSSEIREKGE